MNFEKDISFGEVSYPTVRSSWGVLHAEVQVEPVGQLNLEAHPDGIVPLLTGDVQDEPAGETPEKGHQDHINMLSVALSQMSCGPLLSPHVCVTLASHTQTQTVNMQQNRAAPFCLNKNHDCRA